VSTTRIGSADTFVNVRIFTSGAINSGVWTDSEIVEEFQMQKKVIALQNVGVGSGFYSVLGAVQSGGVYFPLVSGASFPISGAAGPGIAYETMTDAWPYVKVQARTDVSGTNVDGWIVVGRA